MLEVCKIVPQSGVFCVTFCLRSLGRFERCGLEMNFKHRIWAVFQILSTSLFSWQGKTFAESVLCSPKIGQL